MLVITVLFVWHTEGGEMYSGCGSTNKPLNLQRVLNVQNASSVFTDFKASNFAYFQDVYRYILYMMLYQQVMYHLV